MLFALTCLDKKDHLDLRIKIRTTHLDYLKQLGDVVKLAGPLLDSDEKPKGSLLIIEAASLEEAEKIAQNDPYAQAGLFASVSIDPWTQVIKNF